MLWADFLLSSALCALARLLKNSEDVPIRLIEGDSDIQNDHFLWHFFFNSSVIQLDGGGILDSKPPEFLSLLIRSLFDQLNMFSLALKPYFLDFWHSKDDFWQKLSSWPQISEKKTNEKKISRVAFAVCKTNSGLNFPWKNLKKIYMDRLMDGIDNW